MKVRWNPKQQRFPALTRNVVVDTFRGQIRVRKWPRKRGPSKSAAVRRQNKWFTDANALAKRLVPDQIKLAMKLTAGTGLYPRDLLLRQMSGGIYEIITGEGVAYQATSLPREAIMFQGVILQLTANQFLPLGTITPIIWPLPILDTMGLWNVATPEKIIIPAGVEVVELVGGWRATAAVADIITVTVLEKNGVIIANQTSRATEQAGTTVSTGPLSVAESDEFRFGVFTSKNVTALGLPPTFFGLNALQVVL